MANIERFSRWAEIDNQVMGLMTSIYTILETIISTMSNNTYNVDDSVLTSALIIVKHNPANDSSHTKHITVDLIGNNGTHKTVEFTVEVYQ